MLIKYNFKLVLSLISYAQKTMKELSNFLGWAGFMPEVFILLSLLGLLLFAVWFSTSAPLGSPVLLSTTLAHGIFLLILCLWLFSIRLDSLPGFLFLGGNMIFDDFSYKLSIILVICSTSVIFISRDFLIREKINSFEFVIFLLISTLGGCWLLTSYDFLTAYVSIELISLPLYGLAAIKTRSLLSAEAGLKYFILGGVSSATILFGMSWIYSATGSLSFADCGQLFAGGFEGEDLPYGMIGGSMFLSAGLLFKLAAVPFHIWAPDVYEGSPTPVTAFFSIVPKLAVFGLSTRLFYLTFYDISMEWQRVLLLSAIASIIIGTFGAIMQKLDLKRLFAFSAIANVGYILLGLSAGTTEGLQSLLLYTAIYLVITLNAFATLIALSSRRDLSTDIGISTYNWKRDNEDEKKAFFSNSTALSITLEDTYTSRQMIILSQNDLGNLRGIFQFRTISKSNPILGISVAFMFFSIAGVPPLAGFVGKMYLFFAAINSELYLAVFVAIVMNVIGAVYYLRCIKMAYFDGEKEWLDINPPGKELSLVLGFTIFFISLLWMYPSITLVWAYNAAAGLAL